MLRQQYQMCGIEVCFRERMAKKPRQVVVGQGQYFSAAFVVFARISNFESMKDRDSAVKRETVSGILLCIAWKSSTSDIRQISYVHFNMLKSAKSITYALKNAQP